MAISDARMAVGLSWRSPCPRKSLWSLVLAAIVVALSALVLMTGAEEARGREQMGKTDTVRREVQSAKVVIFSKSYCPYCRQAKDIFKKIGERNVHVIELDELSRPETRVHSPQHLITRDR